MSDTSGASRAVASMSLQEDAAEGAVPAAAGAPPRLGDHSPYMPEPMLPLADVRVEVKSGAVLPAHASALVLNCGVLARSSELFVGASAARPAALSAPFNEYVEADVARFLRCIYTAAAAPAAEDVAQPAVVRLAHALDAAAVLAAARRHMAEKIRPSSPPEQLAAGFELAGLRGWTDVGAQTMAAITEGLQTPLGDAETPTQLVLSDAEAFGFANALIESSSELAVLAFGTLAANFRAAACQAARSASLCSTP